MVTRKNSILSPSKPKKERSQNQIAAREARRRSTVQLVEEKLGRSETEQEKRKRERKEKKERRERRAAKEAKRLEKSEVKLNRSKIDDIENQEKVTLKKDRTHRSKGKSGDKRKKKSTTTPIVV